MANATNLNAVDLSVNDNTNPNTYFNNYFGPNVKVSPNVDAAILSYFEEVTYNKEAAKALAAAVIYTSTQQGINPMESLKEFTKLPKGELNAYLVMFLNMNRKGTSYLGITNQPIANKYVSRAIIL
jgi:hypothetical protein